MTRTALPIARFMLGVAVAVLPLGGCAYDYMHRSDGIAYSSGNAVKANLERETANPSRKSSWTTKGLGKNGQVVTATDASADN